MLPGSNLSRIVAKATSLRAADRACAAPIKSSRNSARLRAAAS
jgi:hypothetical protein